MVKTAHIFTALFALCILVSCTSGRWIVKDTAAIDKEDYQVLEQHRFLKPVGKVTPEDPVLKLDLLSHTEYEYSQKVLVQRNIQQYELRPGFVALGLTGAILSFYTANMAHLGKNGSTKSLALNAAGAVMALSGFLNMKPIGEPRPTGEERFLRKTGSKTTVDTLKVTPDPDDRAHILVNYGDTVIFEERSRAIRSQQLQIPLGSKVNDLQLKGRNPGSVNISIEFRDSTFRYNYPVSSILEPYARVTSRLTALRNTPVVTDDNILADLVAGSEIKIRSSKNPHWFKVMYGISENYIQKQDADLVWRSADFTEENPVVTVPRVPFGNIDVESNVPILSSLQYNAYGLIITNEAYGGNIPDRNYAQRDGRLIAYYLNNALGIRDQNIFTLNNVSESGKIYDTISKIRASSNDSTKFIVYLSGYGSLDKPEGSLQLALPDAGDSQAQGLEKVELKKILNRVESVPSGQTLVVADLDFSRSLTHKNISQNAQQDLLEAHVSQLTKGNPNTAFIMGARLNQPSRLYMSSSGREDKKHHIFPYFFIKALQQRKTSVSEIYQYLERNISYTSRRLHDRPQDPLLFGDVSLDLLSP